MSVHFVVACISVYVMMHLYVQMYICMCRSQRSTLEFVLQEPASLPLETLFFGAQSLIGCWHTLTAGLAGHSAPGICMSPPSQSGISMHMVVGFLQGF